MKNRNLKNIALIITILLSGILTGAPTIFAQETVSIAASERGNPYINFTDGKSVANDAGNLSASGATNALAAASADFDRDGVPDLAIAYKTENGGLIAIQRGNVESIFPPNADAQPSPFLPFSLSPLLDLPFAPDYLAAGDFNADGRQDLLAAKIGAANLVLRAGIGNGDFAAPVSIELGGNLTAFAVGEMNNFDNLADVAVGIMDKNQSKVLIFQSRNGAFSGKPETVQVRKSVSALVFGELDAHNSHDLIAAGGDELVFVSGSVGGKIVAENVSAQKVGFQIEDLAIGDFVGGRENEIAVLSVEGELHIAGSAGCQPARARLCKNGTSVDNTQVSGSPRLVRSTLRANGRQAGSLRSQLLTAKVSTRTKADLIISANNQLQLVTNDGADNLSLAATFDSTENPIAVLPMRLNKDALNDLVVLTENKLEPTILMTAPMQILTVSSAANSGANTLRGAIEAANNSAGLDEVRFSIPNPNNPIVSLSPLPAIAEAVTLDATTQPGYAGQPIVAVRGDTAIYFSGGNSVTRGFVNNSQAVFSPAINIDSVGNVFVENSFIGTDRDGMASGDTVNAGVFINESSGNTIGGTLPQARNVISGILSGGSGVVIQGAGASNNRIKGNYIGTDKTGLLALGNYGSGILIDTAASGNVIGGATDGERNIISASGANLPGNPGIGVKIILPMNTFSNVVVENNFIGTNKNGDAALGNLNGGVRVEYNASVAPTAIAQVFDNVISGNTGDGIYAVNNAAALGSNASPQVLNSFLWVGSRSSGNVAPGVAPSGNRIGTNLAGTAAVPNTGNGVRLNKIAALIERSTISGNGASGIRITNAAPLGSEIGDNFIGTNFNGTAAIGNATKGIWVEATSHPTLETLTTKIYDNVISGNTGDGVFAEIIIAANANASPEVGALFVVDLGRRPPTNLNAANTSPTVSMGNRIGTNAAGTAALPNTGNGVKSNNGRAKIEGNIIAFNGAKGVTVANGTGNFVAANSIFSNALLGIDLGDNGVTLNDANDADTGANNLQNFPVVSAVQPNGANLNLSGTFNSTPNKPFTLHFYSSDTCDASNYGEGKNYLGSALATTNAQGNALINSAMPAPLAGNRFVTATATDEDGSTSEFSQCRQFVSSAVRRAPFDFDGDGKTDISIFRPASAEWWINRSSTGQTFAAQFGAGSDKLAPGDYTGDGKTDIAIWRPASGQWFVLRSEDFSFYAFPFGSNGDVPAPSDYDGDGKTDAAVFRPSTVTWYISKSSGGTLIQQFGQAGDVPAVADYDGDAQADIAIFRPNAANGAEWWIQRSSNGQVFATQFGAATDKAVQGDYTGDGKTDVAVFRPSNGNWFVLRSEDFSFYSFPFGTSGDVPASGDYDGDGLTDAAVFRPSSSTWFVNRSTAGTLIQQFGQAGDKPIPNAFVP